MVRELKLDADRVLVPKMRDKGTSKKKHSFHQDVALHILAKVDTLWTKEGKQLKLPWEHPG